MTTRPRTAQAWWRSRLAELQRELGTGDGLTDEQALQRLKRYWRITTPGGMLTVALFAAVILVAVKPF